MGRINIYLPNELEDKFRKEVGKRLGAKRGNLKKAFIEAVKLWIEKSERLKTSNEYESDSYGSR